MSIPGFDPASAPILRRGSSGEWVAFLQGALMFLGYEPGMPDGDFGSNTERAVGRFQADHGLTADGVVGPATWREISEASTGGASGGDTPGGSTEPGGGGDTGRRQLDPATAPLLREGDEGDWVLYLQNLLEAEGADPGPLDGDFGPLTKGAVVRFQLRRGIDVDGVVGPLSWGALKPWADVNQMEPPYGSSVHHGGGSSGGGGHGGSGAVTVAIEVAEQIDEGHLDITFPVTNGGGQRVYARHVTWEAGAEGGSLGSDEAIGEWLDHGATGRAFISPPSGPAPEGETYTFQVTATAVYQLDGGDADLKTTTVTRNITVDDQGRVAGSSPGGGSGGGTDPQGAEVGLTVTPDGELDTVGDGLNLNFHIQNHSATQVVVVTSIEWTVTSGVSHQTGHVDPAALVVANGTTSASDVVPMGPAADEPYSCTATAVALYIIGEQSKRSAPASSSFTIDADGKVGGSAHGNGGGTEPPEPAGQPSYHFTVDAPYALLENTVLYASASVVNTGDGAGQGVSVRASLEGAGSDASETHAETLGPEHGIVAEVTVTLPTDRTVVNVFTLNTSFEAADGSSRAQSMTLAVDPDGSVSHG